MSLAVASSSSPPATTPIVAPAVVQRRVPDYVRNAPRSPPPYSAGSREPSPTPVRRMGDPATPFPMMINRTALRKQIRDEGFASKDVTAELTWRLESKSLLLATNFPFLTSLLLIRQRSAYSSGVQGVRSGW